MLSLVNDTTVLILSTTSENTCKEMKYVNQFIPHYGVSLVYGF